MLLADTSVWIDHLRSGNPDLAAHLRNAEVGCHPFVIGELACGHLEKRQEILALLGALPRMPLAAHHEVLALVEKRRLMGSGVGWVDVHLLASALLAGARLWTLDRRLAAVAGSLRILP